MTSVDFLLDIFTKYSSDDAFIHQGRQYDYQYLLDRVEQWREYLAANGVRPGAVAALEADFSPDAAALFLALIAHACIIVPISTTVADLREEFAATAQVEFVLTADAEGNFCLTPWRHQGNHELYASLRARGHPGLVLFSSGSTGKNKGVVHDLTLILEKFKVSRQRLRTLAFLLFDHIGGINTLLYTLSNAGCLVIVARRSPDLVLKAIADHRVDLLPTTPTFINLVLLSGAYRDYDLSSLKLVTYGTEPMPASTLTRFHQLFPRIKLQQTYGLSEIGIMRSKSIEADSLLMQIGGEDFQTRVVDGILHIKARSAMLGYLNAPSPFTDDGWFDTGDEVEVVGEYLRILGRRSEVINVGGSKVHPAEVESVIQEIPGVAAVTVYGENNPLVGQIVCALVTLEATQGEKDFPQRLRKFCLERLDNYKVPMKINISTDQQYTERFKKKRLMPKKQM
jgi:acyl-CoA synthetase (AMP-forming)/AMP-acid ligase II